jgi:TolB protein
MNRKFFYVLTLFAVAACLSMATYAQAQEAISVDIRGPGQAKMNVVTAKPSGDAGAQAAPPEGEMLTDDIQKDLSFMPFLKVMPESSILGGGAMGGPLGDQIDFKPFALAKVDLVITSNWKHGQRVGDVELRAYEVFSKRLILGKEYLSVSRDQLPEIADRFCMELIALLTGKGDFFKSKIAFSRASGKGRDIWVVSPMGRDVTQITKYGDLGMAVSPAWSWDGSKVAFTLIGSTRHYLGVWSGGKTQVHTLPSTNVVSPRFMPNGTIAVSLNLKGSTDIYALDGNFQPGRALAADSAVDVSPSFDKSGNLMAYVSDRLGSPNIYLKDLSGGSDKRVSKSGGYNTNPCLSPDGKYIVYSKLVGGHRLFLYDIAADQERQISNGPGNDENPSFSPDSYFIAFSSTRGGGHQIYITTINGENPILVPTGGEAKMPSWGPTP